jgi:hypothetical protein
MHTTVDLISLVQVDNSDSTRFAWFDYVILSFTFPSIFRLKMLFILCMSLNVPAWTNS